MLLPDLTMSPSPCKSTKEAEQKARKTDIMEGSAFSSSVGLNCLRNPWPSGEAILSETLRRQAAKNYCWDSSRLSDLEAFGNTYVFMYKRKWIFSFLEISHLSRSINGMYHFRLHAQTLTLPVCYPPSLSAERGKKGRLSHLFEHPSPPIWGLLPLSRGKICKG